MVEINAASVSIFITVLIALLGLACAWGVLHQKVKNNRDDIDKIEQSFQGYQTENKRDHENISRKLDTIIMNGHKGG